MKTYKPGDYYEGWEKLKPMKECDIKTGDLYVVIKEKNGHKFVMGEIVEKEPVENHYTNYKTWWSLRFYELAKLPNKCTRHTYETYKVRSDGIVFKKGFIGDRSIDQVEQSMKEKREEARKEQNLLLAYHNLFPKK